MISWGLVTALQDYLSTKWRKQFKEDLQLAIKHSQPSWDQLQGIAETRHIRNGEVYWILQGILRDILTGRNTELEDHREVVEGYLSKLKEIEPFDGIPSEIRIYLERVQEQLPKAPDLLQPLTSHIRELLAVNAKDKRQQKYFTIGGFFVGFVGLIFATLTYFYPYTNHTSASAVRSWEQKPQTAIQQKSEPSNYQNSADPLVRGQSEGSGVSGETVPKEAVH